MEGRVKDMEVETNKWHCSKVTNVQNYTEIFGPEIYRLG
jgi:hypothetical protein